MREFLRGDQIRGFSVISKNSTSGSYFSGELPKSLIQVFEPKKFEDIYQYVSLLDEGSSIIINLASINKINPNINQRCIDFISGAVFRSEGKITEIGPSTIICTTKESNVEIMKEDIKLKKK